MIPCRPSKKLPSVKTLFILATIVLGNLSLFLPWYLAMIFGFIFVAFLPGYLFLNFFLKLNLGTIETLAFSYFTSMALLTLFIMPIDMVCPNVQLVVPLFINLLIAIAIIFRFKIGSLNLNIGEPKLKCPKIFTIFFVLVFFLNLFYNIVNKIRSDGSLFVDWDHGIYLSLIIAMSKGIPATDLLRSGITIQPEMGFFPHFYFYGILLNFTKIPVFYLILFINAFTHSLFAVLVYFIMFRLFHNRYAAMAASFFLSLGSEIYWVIQYFGFSFPTGWPVPFDLYLGTAVPFGMIDGYVNVPSVGMDSIAKGFHHLPSLAFCLLFIYFLSLFWERKEMRCFLAALICLFPMAPSQPLVFLFFVLSFLPLFLIVLFFQKHEARRVLPLVIISVAATIIWFIMVNVVASETFVIYIRYYPICKTLTCLFLYLGALFILCFLGMRSGNVKNRLSSSFLFSWILSCMFFILFTDLFHVVQVGSWHGYFVYFSLQVPWMMFAGIGFVELCQKIAHPISPKVKSLRKFFTNNVPKFSLIILIVIVSLIPHYQYYTSWVTHNNPFYSNLGIQVSRDELAAYEWINLNTPENSVFLVNPNNWALTCFTGRPIIITDRGIPENDERILDVRSIFTLKSLKGTLLLLSKYNVSYIFISSIEKEKFGAYLQKFYAFSENFQLRFSNGEVDIVEIKSFESLHTIPTSLTIVADNASKAVNQPIKVSGILRWNDTNTGMENMTVNIEQFPPYQLTKGLKLPFDEGSGFVCYDASMNGNDGVIHGTDWVYGKYGKALSFNGISDYVEVAHSTSLSPTNEIKVDLWLNIGQYGDFKRILVKSPYPTSDYGLLTYRKSVYFFVTIGGIEYQSPLSKPLNLNTWYHVVGTYKSGDKVRVYIDDEEQGSGTDASGTIDNHSEPLLIGGDGVSFFSGVIDELKIYTEPPYSASSRTDTQGNYEFQIVSQIAGSATFRVLFDGDMIRNDEFLACTSPAITLTWTKIPQD